jgi:hypothetical protein
MTFVYGERSHKRHLPVSPLSKVFGDAGFSIDVKLLPDEVEELRRLTAKSWLDVIRRAAPDKLKAFETVEIDRYHELSHLIDHARMWTTETRTFSAEIVDVIRSFSLFDLFDRECPGYRICSEMPPYGDLGRGRMNWRLVRPGDGTDLGPVHADYWFETVVDGWAGKSTDTLRVKIWIPIYLEPGLTGFAYLPRSHKMNLAFTRKPVGDSGYKPYFDPAHLPAPLVKLDTRPGTAVLFNYNLVHQGANSTRATRTRVSMETTLEVSRHQLEQRYGDLSRYY